MEEDLAVFAHSLQRLSAMVKELHAEAKKDGGPHTLYLSKDDADTLDFMLKSDLTQDFRRSSTVETVCNN